jgi:hypothetical protein
MITFTKERFTPASALRALQITAEAGFHQRRRSDARVKLYAGAMARGNWDSDTGEVVKFARYNGTECVIDGQHRLQAIADANVKLDLWVCRGLDVAVFRHLDQGQARNVSDMMTIAGWPEASTCSSAGRMLWKEDSTGSPFVKPEGNEALSEGDIAQHIEDNYRPALIDHVIRHKTDLALAQRRGVGGKAWLAYLGMRAEALDAALWERCLHSLAVPTAEAPHPSWKWAEEFVRKIRDDFKDESPSGRILMGRNRDLCDVTVRAYAAAWKMTREGVRCTSTSKIKAAITAQGADWEPLA